MRRRKSLPWFKRRTRHSTVYLMQDVRKPNLIKIGFTTRRTHTRKNELSKKTRDGVRIIYTISMPHAYFAEQRILRRMRRRWFGAGSRRGTEWFGLRPVDRIERITSQMLQEAKVIRFIARLKFSWPANTEIREYRSAIHYLIDS